MARLPQPGGDAGNWGSILNDYLATSHKADGTIKDSIIVASNLATGSVTQDAILDGSVMVSSLTMSIQNSLARADTAAQAVDVAEKYTKPSSGIPFRDINQTDFDEMYAKPSEVGAKTGIFIVSACGGNTPSSSLGVGGPGVNIVNSVRLPVATKQWRLHIRNYNTRDAVSYPGQVFFNGVWLSPFTDIESGWDAKSKTVPIQVLSGWTASDLSTEYTSPWITASNQQFQKHVGYNLSFGYTAQQALK